MRRWAVDLVAKAPAVRRIGYFGSYARADWGVGSDVDLVVIVDGNPGSVPDRASWFDVRGLPVPADLLVYSQDEWQMLRRAGRFAATVEAEAVWVFESRP